MANTKYFVYLLRCSDNSIYTGIAKDIKERITKHNLGKGAKYTRGRRPVKLIHSQGPYRIGKALKTEREIKKLSRQKKLELAGHQRFGLCKTFI